MLPWVIGHFLEANRVLLQAGPVGVDPPVFPILVALVGLATIVIVSLGALRMPRMKLRRREPRAPKPTRHHAQPVPVEAPIAPAPVPVYKKAPVAILFPMIKPQFPDVWGLGEKAVLVFKVEDKGLITQREIPGLSARLGPDEVPLVFYRGEARLERMFDRALEVPVTLDLKVRGEKQPRRAVRILRIVKYREEIADLFAEFKEEISRTITPLRADATPWEIFDSILDAKPGVSQVALREIVSSFEEAKFSNHPVGRATYEKMVLALRAFKPGEA